MEIDGDLEVVRIAIAADALLDGSDLGIQSFCDGVGDTMGKAGQHVGQVAGDQFGSVVPGGCGSPRSTGAARTWRPTSGMYGSTVAKAAHSHWGVENQLHQVLDVTFREDDCRVRKGHAPQNLSALRKFALSLLRQDKQYPKRSLRSRRPTPWLSRLIARPRSSGVNAIALHG